MKIEISVVLIFLLFSNLSFAVNANSIVKNEIVDELEETQKNDTVETDKTIEDVQMVEENILRIKDVKDSNKGDVVVLQALNKITGKTYKYEVKVDDKITFERIIIEPLFCWKSSPDAIPENKVLLRITENKLDKTQDIIFYGWMFSSSPGISSLEHPMYDITIIDCLKSQIN